MTRHTSSAARAAAASFALAIAGTALVSHPAHAGEAPDHSRLMKDLISPLSAAIAKDGTAWVSQNFAGSIVRHEPGKKKKKDKQKTVYQAPKAGTEVGALSERKGRVHFATTLETDEGIDTALWRLKKHGKAKRIADLSAHEAQKNPDGDTTYGVRGLDPECAAQFPEHVPASYPGIVESHPYATYQVKGATYVADAAANAILKVTKKGKVSTVAVLPGAPLEITAELAEGFGIPECAIGEDYWFESVPTDVELGPDGDLYVSSLPGGPEDPSLGARGSIFRVDLKRDRATRVVEGLVSPTGVAVTGSGDLYVTQLFAGMISKVESGGSEAKPFAELPLPGDVESAKKGLYATVNVLSGSSGEEGDEPAGELVRWRR